MSANNQDRDPSQSDAPVTLEAMQYSQNVSSEKLDSLRTLTIVIYILQGLTYFTAITGIVGVIINYVKRGETVNTWVASHFRWQIRTFWYALLWFLIGVALTYFVVGILVLLANGIWVIYRIVRGVLAAIDRKPMYQ